MIRLISLAGVLCALVSCQSAPELGADWGPVEVLERFEVDYTGAVLTGGADREALASVDREAALEPDPNTPQWEIRLRILAAEDAVVARLLGASGLPRQGGRTGGVLLEVDAEAVFDAMLDAEDATEISAPRLMVLENTDASLAIMGQTSFIEQFGFASTPDAWIADPDVSVFHDGVGVELRPLGVGEDGKQLCEFRLVWSELLRMEEIDVSSPIGGGRLMVQVPVHVRQELAGSLALHPEEAALLPPLTAASGERLLILVEMRRAAAPGDDPARDREV